jgi:hypothetical protein
MGLYINGLLKFWGFPNFGGLKILRMGWAWGCEIFNPTHHNSGNLPNPTPHVSGCVNGFGLNMFNAFVNKKKGFHKLFKLLFFSNKLL